MEHSSFQKNTTKQALPPLETRAGMNPNLMKGNRKKASAAASAAHDWAPIDGGKIGQHPG